jgi:hypothetical protein
MAPKTPYEEELLKKKVEQEERPWPFPGVRDVLKANPPTLTGFPSRNPPTEKTPPPANQKEISRDMPPPSGVPSDISLTNLNKLINGLETKKAIEEDVSTRNRLINKIDELKQYRLLYSGPHQPPEGTRSVSSTPTKAVAPIGNLNELDLTTTETSPLPEPVPQAGGAGGGAGLSDLLTGPVPKIGLGSGSSSVTVKKGIPYPEEKLARRRETGESLFGEGTKLGLARKGRLETLSQNRLNILDESNRINNEYIQSTKKEMARLTGGAAMEAVPQPYDEPGVTPAATYRRAQPETKGTVPEEMGPPTGPKTRPVKGLIEQSEERFNEASKQLKEARDDIANFKIDPYRGVMMNVIVASIADALRVLGSSIASGGRNLGSGPSYASQILDRNLKVQGAELEKMMNLEKMTKDQRDFTMKTWNEFKEEKKILGLRMAQLDAAKVSNMSARLDVKNAAAEEINKMGKELSEIKYKTTKEQIDKEIAAKEKAADTTITKKESGWRQVVDPKWKEALKQAIGKPGKVLPAGTLRKLAEDRNLLIVTELLMNRVKNKNLTPLHNIPWLPTESNNIMPQVKSIARQLGRKFGTDTGNFAEREGQVMVDSIAGRNWNKAEQTYKRLKEMTKQLKRKFNDEVKMYGNSGYNAAGLGFTETETQQEKLRKEANKE